MNYNNAIDFLKLAQDVTPDGGVSAFFSKKSRMWQASYPETSGYIIPTFLEAGETERALWISQWLRSAQLRDGSMPAGYWNSMLPNPFDTAMALLGWLAMEKVHSESRTLESIERAVGYLEKSWLDDRWGPTACTYYVRNAWPLKEFGSPIVLNILDYYGAMVQDNGWPAQAEDNHDWPLSHFIVYVARGFLECGVDATARKIAEGLASTQSSIDGAIPARLNKNWEPLNTDVCVPAVAQAAVLWSKLGMYEEYERALCYLEALDAPWASDPVGAAYLPFSQTNWTAKFVADAFAIADSHP